MENRVDLFRHLTQKEIDQWVWKAMFKDARIQCKMSNWKTAEDVNEYKFESHFIADIVLDNLYEKVVYDLPYNERVEMIKRHNFHMALQYTFEDIYQCNTIDFIRLYIQHGWDPNVPSEVIEEIAEDLGLHA